MPEVAVMIEGQDGLDWARWRRLARTVEDSGYAGLVPPSGRNRLDREHRG